MKKTKYCLPSLLCIMVVAVLVMGCPVTVDPPDDVTITLLAVPGISAPEKGAVPVTSIDTEQYTGSVIWNPTVAGTFAASTTYTATITLAAKAGYTLTGIAANSFVITGATSVNHSAGSGIITAVFPKTLFSLNMIVVPAGRFQRDGTASNISEVSAFRMSQYEITREQFLIIMGTDPSDITHSSGISDPVQKINWYHALAFCNKLSLAEGLNPVYAVTGVNFNTITYAEIPVINNEDWNAATATWTNDGYRLPTEMEWMWAAMGAPADGQGGGTNTTGHSKAFAGSSGTNSIGDYAVFGYNWGEEGATTTARTNTVGSKLPNELGLYDMSGNVHELCWDWQEYSLVGTLSDFHGPDTGTYRMIRGGRWNGVANYCGLEYRGSSAIPFETYFFIGFRVVRN